MNSHKFNMYAGSIIGSVLFFLLLGFFSEMIYVGRGHSEHEVLAYAVEIEEADASSESTGGGAETAVDWAALVQGADAANGEKVFGKCKACHKVEEGKNGVGPTLWGVVGRDIASIDGFKYSDTLTGIEGDWDLEHLSGFLEAPKAYAPGTKMSFAGLPSIDDRIDLIAYLNEADGTPMDMVPAGSAAASGASATEAVTEAATAATESATEMVTAATEAVAAATGGGDYVSLIASADAANGEKVFSKCKACHKVEEGKNGVGPTLWGVVGRDIASVDGYKYSDSLTGIEGEWDLEHLLGFLEAPKAYAPGTKMTFPGLKKIEDRIDLIAYLNEVDGTPVDIAPAGGAAAAASGATEAASEAVTAATEAATEAATAATESVTEAVNEAVTAATEAVAAATGGDDYASLLASADAAAGEKVFRKCKACHKVEEGKNGLGPSLWGIVGRDIGSVEGYKYSDPVMATEGNWTGANLFAFLADPKGFIPGNKMSFPGLKKAQDRVNVITYLNEADGSPEPLQ